MHDVVETCLSSLYELAKDPSNRAIIRTDTKVISAVVPVRTLFSQLPVTTM